MPLAARKQDAINGSVRCAGVPARHIRGMDVESAASSLDNAEYYTNQSPVYQRTVAGFA